MPIFAIRIKKKNGNTLIKFKSIKNGKKSARKKINQHLHGTGHKLLSINYVMDDPIIHADEYPSRRYK